MKKRPIRRTPNITMLDEEYRRSLARAQVMSKGLKDGEELHDPSCEKYPPCIICKRAGTLVRKCFFPLDYESMIKIAKSTFCIAICPSCFDKALEEDVTYQCTNLKEVGIRIK